MGIDPQKDSLDLNFSPKLRGFSLGLNLPLNFTKLGFKKANEFMAISLF